MPSCLVLVAVAAAVRGVWSPCGLSMLSTITPLGERSRGHRYGNTAAWYIGGAVLGGLSLGSVLAVLARLVDGAGGTAVVAAAVVVAGSDAGLLPLPIHRRQVNERWLDEYRGWVYGIGFGWQVGSGFATYVTTAANYLLVVLAVTSGSPLLALGAGVLFGLVRGLSVLLTSRVRSAGDLLDVHRRVERLGPPSRRAVIAVEVVVAVVLAGRVGGLAVVALVAVVAATARFSGHAQRSSNHTALP